MNPEPPGPGLGSRLGGPAPREATRGRAGCPADCSPLKLPSFLLNPHTLLAAPPDSPALGGPAVQARLLAAAPHPRPELPC